MSTAAAAERLAFEHPSVEAESDLGAKRELATVVELGGRFDAARARLDEIRRERDQYSFDAATTRGQSPSRRHLEKLLAESSAVEGEILVLESALKTAHARVAAAREKAERSTAAGGWPTPS